jgi:hypothetical protein
LIISVSPEKFWDVNIKEAKKWKSQNYYKFLFDAVDHILLVLLCRRHGSAYWGTFRRTCLQDTAVIITYVPDYVPVFPIIITILELRFSGLKWKAPGQK